MNPFNLGHKTARRREPSSATHRLRWLIGAAVAAAAVPAMAQMTFSIDYQGPPISIPDACAGGPPLTEGDVLRTFTGFPMPGLAPTPCIVVGAGPGGLGIPFWPATVGHPPGMPGFVEVDALSYGNERPLRRPPGPQRYTWHFSVDEWSSGLAIGPAPDVFSEGIFGNMEASADIFTDTGVGPGPICGMAFMPSVDTVDGDGIFPFGGLGLGLIEPNPPGAGVPDMGTNLDGLDVDTATASPAPFPVYFSLDAGFFDPIEGIPNSGSALANGLGVGGDVLVTMGPGAFPMVFAPAFMLGLDLFGPDTDDLDALVLWENGTGVYEPSPGPYGWVGGGADMLLFSVRRGSAIIGMPDSFCGMPIEPGDILFPPPAAGMPPGIWIPAEALSLATFRAGVGFINDDLDALDVTCNLPGDLNGDGVVDLIDLSMLLANFGCVGPGCVGDINFDGVVDLIDLSLLLAGFGAAC